MNILIVTYHELHETTPRAFRAKSLVDAFQRLGHSVEFVSSRVSREEGIQTVSRPKALRRRRSSALSVISVLSRLLSGVVPDGKVFFSACKIYPKLRNKDVDLVISIGLPFTVHIMTALAIRTGGLRTKKAIADYGDPYSGNPVGVRPFYAKALERWVLSHFDGVSVPLQSAVEAYHDVVDSLGMITIIPQGCNIERDFSGRYSGNARPTFAYAGNLYKDVRDPTLFLEELTKIEVHFDFHFYTELRNTHTMIILEPFLEKLRGKLHLHNKIPRDECLEVLSGMDFLVSFRNASTIQAPSKIIDYVLSSRPFLEIGQGQSDFAEFYRFFRGDYSGFVVPDISAFDEIAVAKKFLSM
jgi:hypothetical protein